MTSWGIKILRLEESALKHLDVIFSHHGAYAILGIVCLLMLLFVWVIVDVSRRKARGQLGHVRPVIFIESSSLPPRPPEPESPFPRWRECDCHHDRWDD
jgi:hypothetical protein